LLNDLFKAYYQKDNMVNKRTKNSTSLPHEWVNVMAKNFPPVI